MLGALVGLAACGGSETGVEVVLRVGQLDYDELRLGVTDANGTLVDPDDKGHFVAPFHGGDQSVVIYLSDTLDGTSVQCTAEAWRAGAAVASGAAGVTVHRHEIARVEIVMGGPGGSGGAGDAGATGGAGGTGGANTGTDAGSPSSHANGEACSVGGECASGHCSDGVCCEEECQKACRSCALPDTKGLCRPVSAGTPDPRAMCDDKGAASCGTNGLCDVAGDCALYHAGTVCDATTCTGMDMAASPARTCDGSGHCQGDAKKMKCPASP